MPMGVMVLTSFEIAKLIQYYPVLADLPACLQYALSISGCLQHAEAGETLYDPNLAFQSFLMLTRGSIKVTWLGNEREILLCHLMPGDCCSLTACSLLCCTSYPARAQVVSAITGVAIPQPLFTQMVHLSPTFCTYVFHSLSEHLTGLLGLLESFTPMQLESRLAGLLLSRGNLIRTTHSELANELGSAREVISRILEKFEIRGLVQLRRCLINIIDEESLKHIHRFGDSSH